MPKILHIGGSDSPHVLGIIEQIKQNTNFKQTIISYTYRVKASDSKTMEDVKLYKYDYPQFFTKHKIDPKKEKDVRKFVSDVIRREKPDIVHGHYPSKCAVPMFYALADGKIPGIISPWSKWDIATNPRMFSRIKRCLILCSYVTHTHKKFINAFLDAYGQPRSKFLFSGYPIRLHFYKDAFPDLSKPRIYVPRRYYQEIIFSAFPKILMRFPDLEITALSPISIQRLAEKLKIYDKIKFLPDMLSQESFSKMIKRHNIIFSMAPDIGTSCTTLQIAYFGAVALVHKTHWTNGILDHGKHVVECDLNQRDVEEKLIYSIENYKALCMAFKKNNTFLEKFGAEITWNNLFLAYKKLLAR